MTDVPKTECGERTSEQKAIYAAVAVLQDCHRFETMMNRLEPDSPVLALLKPLLEPTRSMIDLTNGERDPLTLAMYNTGDLVRFEN